ncbi:MFS transporter [Acinetobacter sp. WCHAc010052]|nr:MFS transporter [Acinetobacter sp. WCHAc010052]
MSVSDQQRLSRDLWIICAGFVAAMHVGKLPPSVPILQNELGISFVQAGLLLSLVQLAGMLSALSLGSFTEKFGLKRCVLTGLLLLSLASAVGSQAHGVEMLLGLRVVEGFGFLLVTLSGPAYIRQLVSVSQLQTRMGLWSAYMGGGMGIALFITPYLITLAGWQGVWIFFSVLSLLLGLCILFFVPEPKSVSQHSSILKLIKSTLVHRPAWILAGIFGVYAGQWFSMVGFLPAIYQQNHIVPQLAGALTACVAIANAVGTFLCGLMLQRGFSAKTLVQLGFSVLSVSALFFYISMNELNFFIQYGLVFSFSLFGGLVAAVVFSQALHFAPSPLAISATVGLILQCSASSQFILPPVIAMTVSETGGWFWIGIMMAALSCIGILLSQRLFKQKQA